MTYDEIAVHLNDVHVPAPRVASRGKELWDGGWIEPATTEAGEQVERQTRAGNGAIVWVLTEGGRGEVGPWLWEDDTSGPDARSAPARRADRLRDEGLRLTELPG